MITRISKIARLPKEIREQLNQRLDNGELGRTLLPWLNELPETKKVLAELFAGKPVTHQNLSEWRHGGYQDWLQHQFRLEWFDRLQEQDTEISEHDGCSDTYEAMSRFFVFEIGQALAALQKIKNPDDRWARLQNLTREFSRLQNSYNWSRRVALEWDKYKDNFEYEDEDENPNASETEIATEEKDGQIIEAEEIHKIEPPQNPKIENPPVEKTTNAPRNPEAPSPRWGEIPSSPNFFSGEANDHPSRSNSPEQIEFVPIPTPSPTTPSTNAPNHSLRPPNQNSLTQNSKTHHSPPPIRGRRFVCIEG